MAVQYLSVKELLVLHGKTIAATGGSAGIRDESLVESALARPRAGFGDFEAYPDIFSKAAILFEGLIKNHGFVDGNKRTAAVATIIFLSRNGYWLRVGQMALVSFSVGIAAHQHQSDQIAAWLTKHSKKI